MTTKMNWRNLALAMLMMLGATCAAEKEWKTGEVYLKVDLTDPKVRQALQEQGAEIVNEGPNGEPCIRITSAPVQAGNARKLISVPFDIAPMRGGRLTITAMVRAKEVRNVDPSAPLPRWLGTKCQLTYDSASQGRHWCDEGGLHGTFGWKQVGAIGSITEDATEGEVALGIERAVGTVWMTDVRLTVAQARSNRLIPANAETLLPQKTTQMRGVMSPSYFAERDFVDLAGWKANLIRWQLGGGEKDLADYDGWLDKQMGVLAKALDSAQANGIKLIIDLHLPPGGRYPDATLKMLMEEPYQKQFIATWEKLAQRFKNHPAVWAYDLINEPVQNRPSPPGLEDWLGLQVKVATAIRAIDAKTPIIFESDEWDSPEAFASLQPVNIPNVIYQTHMYWPGSFTHQGVKTDQGVAKDKDFTQNSVTYPGVIDGKKIDKEALRRYLEAVRKFQLANHARIYIGEFSAVRWAPGAAQYLDDCISIFEEYGWDWTYHAFREWPGWSVEHADLPYDRKNHPLATQPTDRFLVLQKWLSKNAAPVTADVGKSAAK